MWGNYDRETFELLKRVDERVERIEVLLGKTYNAEIQILNILRHRAVLLSSRVSVMPKTITVGQTAQATIVGVWSDGQTRPLDSTYTVSYNASSPADVSFATPNSDGSDVVTGVNADPGDSIGASITRPDGTVIVATPDTLTITAAAPVLTGASVQLS